MFGIHKINKRYIFFFALTSIFIALLYFIANLYNFIPIEYNYSVGDIADRDIIAPYDFPIYVSEEQLKNERNLAASKTKPIYEISQNLKFNALKNLDFIFSNFTNYGKSRSLKDIKKELGKNKYGLSDETISYLSKQKNRREIYNYLTEKINKMMDVGIYPSSIRDTKIKLYKNNKITTFPLKRLYSIDEAKKKLTSVIYSKKKKRVIEDLAKLILRDNIVVNNNLTQMEIQKARDSVPITRGKVLKNEKIISKNQKITPNDLIKLNSLIRIQKEKYGEQKKGKILLSSFGIFFLSFLLLMLFMFLSITLIGLKEISLNDIILFDISFFTILLIQVLMSILFNFSAFLLPYFFTVLIISQIYGYKQAFLYNIFQFLFLSAFLRWNVSVLSVLFLVTLFGLFAGKYYSKRKNDFIILIYLILGSIIVATIVAIVRLTNFFSYLKNVYYLIVNVSISYIIYILVLPFAERRMNKATKRNLLELVNMENRLLKELSSKAPGTYHHSLKVGNLAETAAEAIDANYLLARTGGYYHDVGKLYHPEYFSENNKNSSEIHDKLLPNESALLIKKHVSEGIKLAKRYNLPKPIIDIIMQHHGDSITKYFYHRAKSIKMKITPKDFRYPGPKPQTKESAIVMIADSIESIVNSKQKSEELDKENIRNIITETIRNMMNEGQLDESPLTLSDLKKIKDVMLPMIEGIYSQRIEYPKDESNRESDNY